mgnify:FL=1
MASVESDTQEVAWTAPQDSASAWSQVMAGHDILKDGARGPSVRLLQEKLQELGYGVSVDGIFGRQTEMAVKAFQTHRQLTVDGAVGPQTAAALEQVATATPEPEELGPVEIFMRANPSVKTAQDFINYCYRRGGGTWVGAKEMANQYGLDLNELARDRGSSLSAWAD